MPAQKTDTQSSPNIDIGNPYTPRRPAPIVSISVNHPIAALARKIKNFLIHKQTLFSTSFNIKVTPIVALVSFFGVAALFGSGITTAFNFGKTVEQRLLTSPSVSLNPTPLPNTPTPLKPPTAVTLSRAGTIKTTYLFSPASNAATPELIGTQSSTLTTPPTLTPTQPPILHYILVSRSGSISYLAAPGAIQLRNYINLRVLITGSFDSTKNTLTITKPEDIEVLQ